MTHIVGLTGSIGMGKSTVAGFFRYLNIPVHDSDATVHKLLGPQGKALSEINAHFPNMVSDKGVDRVKLGQAVFGKPDQLKRLEDILHPMVQYERDHFLKIMQINRRPICVLDIPLLFEKNLDPLCSSIMVVTAPFFLQKQRVLKRPNMTSAKFENILKLQQSDLSKCRRADFVISSGLGKAFALRQVMAAVHSIKVDLEHA